MPQKEYNGSRKRLAVIALGGNALCTSEDGSQEIDLSVLASTAEKLLKLLSFYESLVVTYGNGPQVGNDLLRSEAASDHVVPLEIYQCTANTQGRLGSALEIAIRNATKGTGIKVYGLLSHVLVEGDHATSTKPVGPFYDKSLPPVHPDGALFKEVSPGKLRRVVSSPMPVEIIGIDELASLLSQQTLIMACGGGGVPLSYSNGILVPVKAVIDKDLTSSLLARSLNADLFMIVTKSEGVALGFNSSPRYLSQLTVEEALYHLQNGEFPPGNMGPKVTACISYVWRTGKEAVITSLNGMVDSALGKGGTRFINELKSPYVVK